MKKFIFMLTAFILVLSACSSNLEPVIEQPEINDPGSNGPSEPIVTEPESEEPEIDYEYYENLKNYTASGVSEFDEPSSYDDLVCFTFEVPDLTGMDKSELPYLFENPEWCINGTDWIQQNEEYYVQYVCEGEEAFELAKAIALLNNHYSSFGLESKTFSNISEAHEKELLWTAILKTPVCGTYDKNHAFSFTFDLLYDLSEGAYVPCEVYSVSDVEKTFRYFFGDKANFVPQNIPSHGIRYFEELGVFVQFFDGIMTMPEFPQIVSITKENSVYTVEAVMATNIENLNELGFMLKLTDGTWKELPLSKENVLFISEIIKPFVYTFEKAEDGHFILTGFSY